MTEQPLPETPEDALESVEKAIQHWCSVRRPGVLLTGFVLHYATTKLDEKDGSPAYQVRYAVGESTDLVRAAGISDLGHRIMIGDIVGDDDA